LKTIRSKMLTPSHFVAAMPPGVQWSLHYRQLTFRHHACLGRHSDARTSTAFTMVLFVCTGVQDDSCGCLIVAVREFAPVLRPAGKRRRGPCAKSNHAPVRDWRCDEAAACYWLDVGRAVVVGIGADDQHHDGLGRL